jgi:hypothetical protein
MPIGQMRSPGLLSTALYQSLLSVLSTRGPRAGLLSIDKSPSRLATTLLCGLVLLCFSLYLPSDFPDRMVAWCPEQLWQFKLDPTQVSWLLCWARSWISQHRTCHWMELPWTTWPQLMDTASWRYHDLGFLPIHSGPKLYCLTPSLPDLPIPVSPGLPQFHIRYLGVFLQFDSPSLFFPVYHTFNCVVLFAQNTTMNT